MNPDGFFPGRVHIPTCPDCRADLTCNSGGKLRCDSCFWRPSAKARR